MAMTPARRRPPPVESTPDPTPPPMLGHNRPRPPTPEEIRELLLDECAELLRRRDELLAGAERFDKANAVITSDEIAGKAADFAATKGAMGQFLARAETNRTTSKEPYLAGSRVVDSWFATLTMPIKQAQQNVMAKVTAYLRAEEDRKRAEAQALAAKAAADAARAEQQAMRSMKPAAIDQAAEAAARAEAAERAAKAKQDTRVVGDLGASVGLRGTWKFVEAESSLMELARAVVEGRAPAVYLAFNTSRIGYAVRSERVRAIPGCVIREERTAT
jgi:cell pole-organizing protein PopZ